MARVLVVGCGNPDAADDAAGVLAVRLARAELEALPGVRVVEGAIGPDLSTLLAGSEAAVVVDAVRTPGAGREPGTIVRAEAGPDGLPAEVGLPLSSHGFGVAEAVGLAAALGELPPIVFLGVEAADVTVGHPPSPEVRGRIPELARLIVTTARGMSRA